MNHTQTQIPTDPEEKRLRLGGDMKNREREVGKKERSHFTVCSGALSHNDKKFTLYF